MIRTIVNQTQMRILITIWFIVLNQMQAAEKKRIPREVYGEVILDLDDTLWIIDEETTPNTLQVRSHVETSLCYLYRSGWDVSFWTTELKYKKGKR